MDAFGLNAPILSMLSTTELAQRISDNIIAENIVFSSYSRNASQSGNAITLSNVKTASLYYISGYGGSNINSMIFVNTFIPSTNQNISLGSGGYYNPSTKSLYANSSGTVYIMVISLVL